MNENSEGIVECYVVIEHLDSDRTLYAKLLYTEEDEKDLVDIVDTLHDMNCKLTKIDEEDYDDFPNMFGDEKIEISLNEGLTQFVNSL